MFRLTVADAYPVVRAGLKSLIDTRVGWSIVAEAQDGIQAVSQAIAHRPHVALVDYSLPLANGLEVTRRIKTRAPDVQVVLLMIQANEQLRREAFSAGARACVLKTETASSMIAALTAAINRENASEENRGAQAIHKRCPLALTSKERRIASLICEGHSNKSAARLLEISCKTIETHRSNIMRKLNLTSTAELVRYGIRNELIDT